MDIYFVGHACFKLKGKNATVVIDPYSPEIGLKLPKDLEADIVLETHSHPDHNNVDATTGNPMLFSGAGEYEVKGAVITGVKSDHDDKDGMERGQNTIYHIFMDGLNIVHLGDLGQKELTETQLQEIGETDILLIPVGGVYTIDGKGAAGIISQLEPKVIIPMHYLLPGLKYELLPVENFLKEMGAEGVEIQPKLSITKDKLPDEPQVMVLKPLS